MVRSREVARSIQAAYGHLDELVNNPAHGYHSENRGTDVDLDDVRGECEANFFGAWAMIQATLPLIRRSEYARIVNVSSEGGSLASTGDGTPAYSTSKTALNALTGIIADEVRHPLQINLSRPDANDMGGGGRPVPEGAASVVWGAFVIIESEAHRDLGHADVGFCEQLARPSRSERS